jgi:hypothetical protein
MAVDLGDLVDPLKREVNPPGQTILAATDDEWAGRLLDAFWDGRLDGLFVGYVADSDAGTVSPIDVNQPDMGRDLQQAIVFLAAYNSLFLAIMNTKTAFKAEAPGPVSYETQQSANVLKELAQSLKERRDILLYRLSDIGLVPTYVIDAVVERQDALMIGTQFWSSAGEAQPQNIGGTQGYGTGRSGESYGGYNY